MDADYWIELESSYLRQIAERNAIIADQGHKVLQVLPGTELACKELMEMVVQFLCARYPSHFALDGSVLVNKIRGQRYALGDPMHVLTQNVPEDFAIMLPDDGKYRLRAGVICASTGWNLAEKIGKGLPAIHAPVPDYERMQLSMDRFFARLAVDKPIQRGAWGFEVGTHLHTPPGHPSLRRETDPNLRPEDVYLRVDWQTLRRLPLSGAVVFNFKALFTPLIDLRTEPYVPSLALKIVSEAKGELLRYKEMAHLNHVLKPALAQYEMEQKRDGVVPEGWEPQTLGVIPN